MALRPFRNIQLSAMHRTIDVRDGVRHSHKISSVKRRSRRQRMVYPGIDHEPWRHGVRQCPKPVRECGRAGIEVRVSVKLTSELQLLVDRMGKRQVHLCVLVRSAGGPPAQEKIGRIEIEMNAENVLARQEANLVVIFSRTKAFRHAGARKSQRIADRHRRNKFLLVNESVLKAERIVAKSGLRAPADGLAK